MTYVPAPFACPPWPEDFLILAYLWACPDQRLVHQGGYPIDADGHQVCREGVFFRQLPTPFGIRPDGGLNTFRRLQKNGWLYAVGVYAGQAEYQVHPRLADLFAGEDETWRRQGARMRKALGLPPVLAVVGGA